MKLGELILKGCEGTVKIKYRFIDESNGCCVIGAAVIGYLGKKPKDEESARQVVFDFCDMRIMSDDLWAEMSNRNNKTDETRESIAKDLISRGR